MRRQAGDTLIEVIFAVAILGTVLVGSTLLANYGFRLERLAQEQTVAANLIQQQAEALRNYRDSLVAQKVWKSTRGLGELYGGFFYMQPNGTAGWVPTSPSTPSGETMDADGDPDPAGLYTLSITQTAVAGSPVIDGYADTEMKYDILASWPAPAGGPPKTLTISTYLVDLDGLQPTNCDEGGCP